MTAAGGDGGTCGRSRGLAARVSRGASDARFRVFLFFAGFVVVVAHAFAAGAAFVEACVEDGAFELVLAFLAVGALFAFLEKSVSNDREGWAWGCRTSSVASNMGMA